MSLFIWSVEVVGNTTVSTKSVLKACEQIGICEGAKASDFNYKIAGQQLLLLSPQLSWCSMNLEGCRLTVNVTETINNGFSGDTPSNLKAKADGIITKIDLQSGDCLVKVSDTVAKGDLLVSGILEQNGEFVHAAGSIRAKTLREITVSHGLSDIREIETGQIKTKRVLSAFGLKIPLYLGKTGGTYRSRNREKPAVLFGKELPLRIHEKSFIFIKKRRIKLTESQVKKRLEEMLFEKIKEEGMENATVKSRDYTQNGEELVLRATVSAEEEIAVQEKLLFYTGN